MSRWWWIVGMIIVISTAVFIAMQVVYGQEFNNSIISKSMVDKLIEDTKRDIAREEAYRQELIKRIENSTCTYSKVNMTGILLPDLESIPKVCVLQGTVK